MGIRALRLVAWQIENVTAGLYGQPSVALESDVVDFYPAAPGGSTCSQARITGISFPMDAPAIAAN